MARTLLELGPGFRRRVIMTGTPIADRPYDLSSQIYFLDRGASLGTDFPAFRRMLDLSNDLAHDAKRADVFETALRDTFANEFAPSPYARQSIQRASPCRTSTLRDVSVDLEPRWRRSMCSSATNWLRSSCGAAGPCLTMQRKF